MKKLLFTLLAFLAVNATMLAQTAAPAKKPTVTKPVTATAKPAVVTAKPAVATVKPTAATAKPAVVTPAPVVLKKDGTPDKRYKTAAPAGPLKKDGTADMRYKANKTAKPKN